MSRFVIAAWVAVAAMATILFNTSLFAAEVSLKMVSMMPKKHPIGKSYNGFVTRLNKEFKGEFQIDWRGGPEVIQQFKQPNAVRIGSIDMTLTSPSYVNGILSVSGSANYSNKTYEEIRASGYLDYMAELHAAKGLIYVGELPVTQLKFHLYFNKEIKTIDEIKNLKILKFPSSITEAEREVEAVLFSAEEPLDIETIQSKINKTIKYQISCTQYSRWDQTNTEAHR